MTHDPAARKRVSRAASAFHIPRETARRLLALPGETRGDLLVALTKVDPHAALAWLRVQPPTEAP